MIKKLNNEKGITIITLVVIIVILAIISVVTINILMGEEGLLNKPTEEKDKYKMEEVKEKLEIVILEIKREEENVDNKLTLERISTRLKEKIQDIEIQIKGETLEGKYDGYAFIIYNNLDIKIEGLDINNSTKKYKVIFSGKNIISDGTEVVIENSRYQANLIVDNGYKITSINVKMGEKILTEGTDFNYTNGVLKINKVTGNLEIVVKTEKILVTKIQLNKTNETIYVGETLKIEITSLEPNNAFDKSVKWTSSNTTVATVTNGIVAPVSSGNTTITAKALDGSEIYASCEITVIEKVYLFKDGKEIAQFEECAIQTHNKEDGYSFIETELTNGRAAYQLADLLVLDEYKSIKADLEVTNFIYNPTHDTAFELLITENEKVYTGALFRGSTLMNSAMNLNKKERKIYTLNIENVMGTYGVGLRKNASLNTQVGYKLYNLWLEK